MYIVSACLAGVNSRYDGKNNENTYIVELMKKGYAIPVCPEQLGGLSTPRLSCEIIMNEKRSRRVINKDGHDRTKEFTEGAEKTLAIAKVLGVKKAILKSRSPSCGCGLIYDGTFSGELITGNGFTAELLISDGIEVYSENDLDKLQE